MDDNKPVIEGPQPTQPIRPRMRPSTVWPMLLILALVALIYFGRPNGNRSEISYDFFWKQLQADNIDEIKFEGRQTILGRFKTRPQAPTKPSSAESRQEKPELLQQNFVVTLPPVEHRELIPTLLAKGLPTKAEAESDSTFMVLLLYLFFPVLLLVGLWMIYRRTRDQFLGGGILSGFSKSPAKRYEESGKKPVTFKDVAGLEDRKSTRLNSSH